MPGTPANDALPRQSRLRDKPQQRRARQRLDAILNAAEKLVEEMDAEAITTNLIADRAGVPVSSVYRYFKTVSAVLAYLFEDLNEEIIAVIEECLANSQPGWDDWREVTGTIITRLHLFLMENPGYWKLLLVMQTSQELRDAKAVMIGHVADMLSARWRQGQDGFSGGDPDLVARFTVEIFMSIETRCAQMRDPQALSEMFAELVKALEAYLSLYLNTAPDEDAPAP